MNAGMKHRGKQDRFRDFLLVLVKARPLRACLSLVTGTIKYRRRLRALSLSLLMMATLVVSSFSPLIPQQTANAAGSMADSLSLPDQVTSFMYYRTLGSCVTYNGSNLRDGVGFANGDWINQTDAKNGAWFADTGFLQSGIATPGAYLKGIDGITLNNNSVDCSKLVNGALKLWGSWAPDQALCAMGFRRVDDGEFKAGRCTNAQGGTDQFMRDNVSKYAAAVKNRVYGGKEPSLSSEAKYLLYLKTFQTVCAPTATISTTPLKGTTTRDYSVRQPSRVGTGTTATVPITMTYYASRDNMQQSDVVSISPGSNLDTIPLSPPDFTTCGDLVKAINGDPGKNNGLADAYALWLKKHPGNADTSGGSKDCTTGATVDASGQPCSTTTAPTCGDAVQGIGWIVCPVFTFVGGLNDMMWGFMSALLTVSPVQQNQTDDNGNVVNDASGNPVPSPTYRVWGAFRTIANVVLAIAFLFMIFSQLTSMGISNYGMKKLLPRWVVAAILINISFPVMQFVVDAANITGSSLYDLIGNLSQFDPTTVSWDKLGTMIAAGGLTVGVVGVGVAAATLAPAAVFAMVLPLVIAGAFGFLAALVVLIMRQALIPILIAVSPVAIAFYLIPNTKPWFDKWKNLLVSMLMLFPIAGIVFGGAKLAAGVISGEKGWWATLLSLVVLSVPLFTLPFLARQAGPMLGKIGGAIKGVSSRAQSLGRSATDPMRKRSIAQARNRVPLWASLSRRRTRTNLETQAYEAEHASEFNKELAGHPEWAGRVKGEAAQAFMRGATSRAEAEELKTALQPLVRELAQVRASGGDPDAFLLTRATSTAHTAAERNAAMHQAAALGRDGVIRRLESNPVVDQTALREAIGANAGSLMGKAPDVVKGADAAFGTATGDQLAGYSSGAAFVHLDHLKNLHNERVRLGTAAAAPGASADDVNAATTAQAKYEQAVSSFNSAIDDVQKTPALQSKFGGDVGKQYTTSAATLPAAVRADLTGLAKIQATDGKIR